MIPTKTRESRRGKGLKLTKNLERLFIEGKCRDCAVVVTRMDFAKILGKFTKVKIQYERSSMPKAKQNSEVTSPKSNARLKSNENGMVLIHRNAYNQHPVKELSSAKKTKPHAPNILRENNRLKKSTLKDKNSNYEKKPDNDCNALKQYGIVFEDPLLNCNKNDICSQISLVDLLPHIDESILPSKHWCIDYFPKSEEPKDDKVYDRIAAELEDLMYNEKPSSKPDDKTDSSLNKADEYPSIMDMLSDNITENKPTDQNNALHFKPNLESSDVEAMLLGKSNITPNETSTPMDIDNTLGNLIEDVSQLNAIHETVNNTETEIKLSGAEIDENPQSPSILDEALQKGIEEHLPPEPLSGNDITPQPPSNCTNSVSDKAVVSENVSQSEPKDLESKKENSLATKTGITHVVFKMTKDGTCYKSVTCPKNLKYTIELDGKSIELLGAPKFISTLEDLQVLLQIVNESDITSLYILH